MEIEKKLEKLKKDIKDMGSVLVVLSGDAVSGLLLKLSKEILGLRAVSASIDSSMYPFISRRVAEAAAYSLGVEYMSIHFDPVKEVHKFAQPCSDRCQRCRRAVSSKLLSYAENEGVGYVIDSRCYNDSICSGNVSLNEQGIKSPFMDAEISRDEALFILRKMGLDTVWATPVPCLVSRIPASDEISEKKLRMVDNAETYIASKGVKGAVVMCHGDLARIIVPGDEANRFYKKEFAEDINNALKEYGFKFAALDLSFTDTKE